MTACWVHAFAPDDARVCISCRECVQLAAKEQPKLESLLVYVAHDCTGRAVHPSHSLAIAHTCLVLPAGIAIEWLWPSTPPVYVGDLMSVYAGHTDKALLVLVPVRLGSEALNPIYIPCVKV